MKKNWIIISIITVAFFSIYSCSNVDTEKNEASIDKNMQLVANTDLNAANTEVTKEAENTPSGKPIHLTVESFKEKVFNYETNKEWKYNGNLPCIIDFYADWCGPCKRVAPILEVLAKEYEGKLVVYKVNTEEQRELAAVFGIRSIPTLLFCPVEGQPQAAEGALPKDAFKEVINNVLLKK